jgi:hypothetical protein
MGPAPVIRTVSCSRTIDPLFCHLMNRYGQGFGQGSKLITYPFGYPVDELGGHLEVIGESSVYAPAGRTLVGAHLHHSLTAVLTEAAVHRVGFGHYPVANLNISDGLSDINNLA